LRLLKPVRRQEHMINRIKDLLHEAVLPTVDVPPAFCAHLDFLWRPCPVLRIHRNTRDARGGTVLVLVVPATIAALFVVTIIEQLLSSYLTESK
jgi:hypothetical protein